MRGGVTKETRWTRVTRFMNRYHSHIVGTTVSVCIPPIFKRSLVPPPCHRCVVSVEISVFILRLPRRHPRDTSLLGGVNSVKPANFVMGVDKSSSVINVIDFGLVKKFRDPWTTMHIPYQQDEQQRVGTSLFASIHTHNSIGKVNHPCPSFRHPEGLRRVFAARQPRVPSLYAYLFHPRKPPMAMPAWRNGSRDAGHRPRQEARD